MLNRFCEVWKSRGRGWGGDLRHYCLIGLRFLYQNRIVDRLVRSKCSVLDGLVPNTCSVMERLVTSKGTVMQRLVPNKCSVLHKLVFIKCLVLERLVPSKCSILEKFVFNKCSVMEKLVPNKCSVLERLVPSNCSALYSCLFHWSTFLSYGFQFFSCLPRHPPSMWKSRNRPHPTLNWNIVLSMLSCPS